MIGWVAAFTWHLEHDSRAWQVAQLAEANCVPGLCVEEKSGRSCEDGLGSALMRSTERAVAAVSGTWQVEHRLSSAR